MVIVGGYFGVDNLEEGTASEELYEEGKAAQLAIDVQAVQAQLANMTTAVTNLLDPANDGTLSLNDVLVAGGGNYVVPVAAEIWNQASGGHAYGASGGYGTFDKTLWTLIGGVVAAVDVRNGTARYSGGGNGSCYVPTASQVLSGVNVDATTGNVTLPANGNNVVSGTNFGVNGTSVQGNLTLADTTYVLSTAPAYGVNGSGGAKTATLTAAGNVLTGTGAFGVNGTSVTPSYTPDFPAVGNVLSTDTVNGASGTLTLPANGQKVLTSQVAFGVSGSSITPSATIPAGANVQADADPYGIDGDSETPTYPTTATTIAADALLVAAQAAFIIQGTNFMGGLGVVGSLAVIDVSDAGTGAVAGGELDLDLYTLLSDVTITLNANLDEMIADNDSLQAAYGCDGGEATGGGATQYITITNKPTITRQ